jgi:hypothetical protein
MNFAAVLLCVVALFELTAWTFTFNALVNGDILYFGLKTIPAFLVGCLFAAAVLWFERQFLTADEAGSRLRRAALLRLALILVAALVTAQPLELLIFRVPIHSRIHAEGIRERAALTLAETLRQEAADGNLSEVDGLLPNAQREESKRLLDASRKALEQSQGDLYARENELGALRSEMRRLRSERDGTTGRSSELDAQYAQVATQIASVSSQASRLRGDIAMRLQEIKKLGGNIETSDAALIELKRKREQKRNLRQVLFTEWVDALRDSVAGKPVVGLALPSVIKPSPIDAAPAGDARKWTYTDKEYDFFEQLRVLWDLVFARPPRWLSGTPEIVRELEDQHGLRSPKPCEAPHGKSYSSSPNAASQTSADTGCDPLAWETEQTRAHVYLVSWIAGHLIAIIIPLLVLIIKTSLLPRELRDYYSSLHQAQAGDPDAMLALLVDQRVKGQAQHPDSLR